MASAPTGALTIAPRELLRIVAVGIVLGAVAAVGAAAFTALVDEGQRLLFADLPGALGIDDAPWWWAGILLLVGAGIVMVAQRMPGRTGLGPLTGFHFDVPLSSVPGVLLAAAATLVFGFALGPEAALIVVGTTVGAILMRKRGEREALAGRLLGGGAAIGYVFGNPLITAFMLLEFAAAGMFPAALMPPLLIALAAGYLVQLGIFGLPGLGFHPLTVSGLPEYPSVGVGDLAVGIAVAILAALVALVVRRLGERVDTAASVRPRTVLIAVALATTAALAVAGAFGASPEEVLFSGNGGMPALVAETSLATVLVILAAKAIAYAGALGGGLRGGPIFPATFLGVAVGIAASLALPGTVSTPLVAAGIAASAAVMTRLPATSALLGALLVGSAGAACVPFAIIGAVAGVLVRSAWDRRPGAPAPAAHAS